MVRINKYLASCEIGSRRGVEELIKNGKVSVNNNIICDLSTNIDLEKDIVKVDGKVVKQNTQKTFIILNKPKGYMVTRKDEFNRKTIYSLLPDFAFNLHPIGRLDYDSEGLLILTNDGDLTNKLIHPTAKIEKTYKVIVSGKITMEDIERLRGGVEIDLSPRIDNKVAKPTIKRNIPTPQTPKLYKTNTAKVFLNSASDEKSEVKITITEGKNRQIRKMVEALGHEIISLKRLQIGDIKLEKLPVGMWRFLKDNEILHLLKTKDKRKGDVQTPKTNKKER